jgi:hypothetical protein
LLHSYFWAHLILGALEWQVLRQVKSDKLWGS